MFHYTIITLQATEKKRSDGFELTGEKASTPTKHNNMEEENLKIHKNLAKFDKNNGARKRGNERPR